MELNSCASRIFKKMANKERYLRQKKLFSEEEFCVSGFGKIMWRMICRTLTQKNSSSGYTSDFQNWHIHGK